MKSILLIISTILVISTITYAQDSIPWHHQAPNELQSQGISLQAGLDYMKSKGKTQTTVIVAVIDSGIDTLHEDLRPKLWHNPKEIPYNNIDDDGNGYIDDYYGWNFIGGADGRNVNGETIEVVRFYRENKDAFENKTKSDIPKADRAKYKLWLKAESEVTSEIKELRENKQMFDEWRNALEFSLALIKQRLGTDTLTPEMVEGFEPQNDNETTMKQLVLGTYEQKLTIEDIDEALKYFNGQLDKGYNLDYDPRGDIIGDNVDDINDTIYGNSDVQAEGYSHGTGVSGIIGAVRNNGIGTQGIVDSVQLMILRVVPGGDERDKDVALAIRYAVKNGATIINGSFGKSYSKHPEFVQDAIQYALDNNVLFIHAAGNSAENNDKITHYPTPTKSQRAIWIDVGASSINNDQGRLAANFSNYGRKTVDIFAPGVNIYSTSPNNNYGSSSGTSDASPVVAGVAALVKSYYPEITAQQLRKVLLESSVKHKNVKTYLPGSDKKEVKFKKLSTTAGIVNAYEALKMAEELLSE
ncbi:MAG: peptidase S8 [Bacteroidetes bacterium 4572_112]|nr:MAG: peptidase S8 [Bacteroidetes bacterium 4572_112]